MFDLIEYLAQQTERLTHDYRIIRDEFNGLFALNRVGYRLSVDGLIVPITHEQELFCIALPANVIPQSSLFSCRA